MAACPLAIFDLDGTLVQLQRRAFVDAVTQLCADFHYPITRRELHLLLSAENMFGFANPEDRDWLELVFWDRYAPREQACSPVPGAAGALRYLRDAGVRIAVATARHCANDEVHAVLAKVGLARLIDDAVSAGVGRRVDKPTLMHQLCERASCTPDAAVSIGDTSADVRAARKARIGVVIAVCSGQIQRRVLADSGPDAVIRSVAALPGSIQELWAGARPMPETEGICKGTSDG